MPHIVGRFSGSQVLRVLKVLKVTKVLKVPNLST